MPAPVPITVWHWVGFVSFILIFLSLDLGWFHRRAHRVKVGEALLWSIVCFALAMIFAAGLQHFRGPKESLQFVTGYLIELSLSLDNVFVIALVFAYFAIPSDLQHRVLFWGILGALVMRGLLIALGAALISVFHWVLYLLGALILYTGMKMLLTKTQVAPEKNPILRWVRKVYPVSPDLEGQRFLTRRNGALTLTPLALALVMVETADLVFALDSIPAIFAVTTKPFIVFTSNVFAILGLRSMYFVLAGAIGYFRHLKIGLSVVLIFIGIKMLIEPHEGIPALPFQIEIPISVSLLVVAAIIVASILLSITAARREKVVARVPGEAEPPRAGEHEDKRSKP